MLNERSHKNCLTTVQSDRTFHWLMCYEFLCTICPQRTRTLVLTTSEIDVPGYCR